MRKFKSPFVIVFIFISFLTKAASGNLDQFQNLQRPPDRIQVATETGELELRPDVAENWRDRAITVTTKVQADGLHVQLTAPAAAVKNLRLYWKTDAAPDWKYLGDAWERAYGDLEWKSLDAQRVMPWYFLASNGKLTHGYGVKTGASAFCYWRIGPSGITLNADVRCGGSGVQLGLRKLDACTIVSRGGQIDETPFAAACAFCKQMCPQPRLPKQSVYGFNDWYCTYGGDTADKFLKDTANISSLASAKNNRPLAVVDDGWELSNSETNPWSRINPNFSKSLTMPEFAQAIKTLNARPGLWFRPLLASAGQPQSWRLVRDTNYLDPTVPAVRDSIKQNIRRFHKWGFELVKHDFTTYDLLGRWGFEMGDSMTTNGWAFADRSRTTAEIIRGLYRDIRDAAGDDTLIIGCNTIGHLAAGLFEIQRIGDDTSGREWARTRKMGINSLAFRLPQNGAFFAVDADCVGQVTTNSIPWDKNSQWLNLLAHSGTAVFVSFAADSITPAQQQSLSAALTRAAAEHPLAEPLGWMDSRIPTRWNLDGKDCSFSW